MRRKIRFFGQHSEELGHMEACGASCMLMLLDLYRKIEYPSISQLRKMYDDYRSKAFCGINGAAVAECLSGYGLYVKLVHTSPKLMENRDEYFPEELYRKLRDEYWEHLSKCYYRIDRKMEDEITCDHLRMELDEGRQIILQCLVPGNADGMHDMVLHWILIYGYEGKEFLACDPLSSKIRLSEDEMERYMDTPTGGMYIAVGEKKPE